MIRDFLSNIHSVDQDVLEAYISHWSECSLPRKTIMTSPGVKERYWYFVIEGIQKSYYLRGEKQHVIAFTYPPSFSVIPESIFTKTPSKYYLETITPSKFLRI